MVGFQNNVPPFIIGSINNLQIISANENCSKQDKCIGTLSELFE